MRQILLLFLVIGPRAIWAVGADDLLVSAGKSVPFVSGTEGYDTFRIPALVRAADGSLLAFCEGRVSSHKDHGNIDIVMRRSSDDGKTWESLRLVQEEGDDTVITIGNPVPIVDSETGRIHLLFCRNNERVFYTISDDHGDTWAERREITDTVKRPEWNWYATGPGGGIQLKSGRQKGRLIVACDHTAGDAKRGWPFGAHVIYSDDNGESWQIGAVSEGEVTSEGKPVCFHSNENAPLELLAGEPDADSRLYFTFRNQNAKPGVTARGEGWSFDGGNSYAEPGIGRLEAVVSPIVHVGIIHLREKASGDTEDQIVMSAPNHPVLPGKRQGEHEPVAFP